MQGFRGGLTQLGQCYLDGVGCAVDREKAIESFKVAAELNCRHAQYEYAGLAFGERDWERYKWWVRSTRRGQGLWLSAAVVRLLPSFERGELGRILHVSTPTIRANLNVADREMFHCSIGEDEMGRVQRVIALHDAMLGRARRAVDCWSMAARRCGMVKDIRVAIAKMAWEEAWRWGEKGNAG
jgi:hypothetical protein